MKLLRSLIAFIALLSVSGVTSAIASGNTVMVTNGTTYTIYELYASSSSASGWNTSSGNNLIAASSIQPGQSVTVNIPSGGWGSEDNPCSYDLMGVLYGSDQYAYDYGVNACNGDTWTITPSS